MLGRFIDTITQTVRGWWLVLADNPWLALLCAVLAVVLLPLVGYAIGRLTGRRRAATGPVATAAAGTADPASAKALAAAQAAAAGAQKKLAEAVGAQKAAETAAAGALSAQKKAKAARAGADTRAEDDRRKLAEATTALQKAEAALAETTAARKKAEAALTAAEKAAHEATAARERDGDALRAALARAEHAEAALQAATEKTEADRAEADARAKAAAEGAAEAARKARAEADAAIAAATAEAEADAAEKIGHHRDRADADIAAARAEAEAARQAADAAEAARAAAQAALDAASDAALQTAAARAAAGTGTLAEAQAAAMAYVAHHRTGIGAALRHHALGLLTGPTGDPASTLGMARAGLDTARALTPADDPAVVEDDTVLAETLVAAAANPDAAADPAQAEKAGLPRLAEVLWRARGEAEADGTALAAAAGAALWAARWPQAAALAARAAVMLAEDGAAPRAVLDARLTLAQAVLFSGAPGMPAMAETLLDDAVAALGETDPLVYDARRLLARALFEAGQADDAEAVAARLQGGPVDPTVDPVLRTARARGLQVAGDPDAAQRLFEALARQAGETKRAGLGHRLDAAEAALAAGERGDVVRRTLSALREPLATAFGARHPRMAQWSLLYASALADVGEAAEARAALDDAERLFAPRLDPAHRWRVAATTLGESLEAALAEQAAADAPEPTAPDDTAEDPRDEADGDGPDTERDHAGAARTQPTLVDMGETGDPERPGDAEADAPEDAHAARPAPGDADAEPDAATPDTETTKPGPWGAYAAQPAPQDDPSDRRS